MKKTYLSLILLCALSACSSSDDNEKKDMTYPLADRKSVV